MACSFSKWLDEAGYTFACAAHDIDYDAANSHTGIRKLWAKITSDFHFAKLIFSHTPWHSWALPIPIFLVLSILPMPYYKYYRTKTSFIAASAALLIGLYYAS